MSLKIVSATGLAVCLFTLPALTHHSFTMYDRTTEVAYQGKVVEMIWVNPHSWLEVMVIDEQGQETQWGFEMSAPVGLVRDGSLIDEPRRQCVQDGLGACFR